MANAKNGDSKYEIGRLGQLEKEEQAYLNLEKIFYQPPKFKKQ